MEPISLSKKEKKAILDFSKACLKNPINKPENPILEKKYPVSFSLYKDKQLRGRASIIKPKSNLAASIQKLTKAAAFRDPRFNPVSKEELTELELEISILGDYELIQAKSPHELLTSFELGRDGLLLRKKLISAVSLPQEVEEEKLSRMEFVSKLCQKAGLKPLEWWKTNKMNIYRFSVLMIRGDFRKF
jgi:AmmeMemoRadiSam system protein A